MFTFLSRMLAGGTLLALCAVIANASPLKLTTYQVQCKTINCGIISNAPKAALLLVNPTPLPRLDVGDPQQVTVQWRMQYGLKANYSLCLTASSSTQPANNDPCVALPKSNLLHSTSTSSTFEDTLALPFGIRRPTANFYVRTTSIFHLIGGAANWTASNEVPFTWPLTLPNLYAHNPGLDFSEQKIRLVHRISNRSNTAAGKSITRFVVDFCDANHPLPLSDPEDHRSEGLCSPDLDSHIATINMPLSAAPGPLAAGTNELTYKTEDISAVYPNISGVHWISITAMVDADQAIDESNEADNNRLETLYMQ